MTQNNFVRDLTWFKNVMGWCWNDSGMMEWSRNDGMIQEWWNDPGMMEWCRNDVNESGMSSFHSHAIIPLSFHHSSGIPPFKTFKTRGSDASELAFSKSHSINRFFLNMGVNPPNPLCRGGWVDWLHALNDRNDSLMMEWSRNDVNDSGMRFK